MTETTVRRQRLQSRLDKGEIGQDYLDELVADVAKIEIRYRDLA